MKAICIRKDTLQEIAKEVTWRRMWAIRRLLKSIERHKIDTTLYFIPYYMYPEAGSIPRDFIVSRQHLGLYFEPDGFCGDTPWIIIIPKNNYQKAA